MDSRGDGVGLPACVLGAGHRGCSRSAWSPAGASRHPGPAADGFSSGSCTQPPPPQLLAFAGQSGGHCHTPRCLGSVTECNPPLSQVSLDTGEVRLPANAPSHQLPGRAALSWLAWVIWRDSSGGFGRLIAHSSSRFRPMW